MHDWSATMGARRISDGARKEEVLKYLGTLESFYCVALEGNDNKVECEWVGIRGKANQADILVGAC